MMRLNGLVGDPMIWVLLVNAWLSLGALFALALGVIARVGAWHGREK